jgi:hypothetical protein
VNLSKEPFDRALEIRKPPQKVRDAAIRVNDDLEMCAKIYQQVSGKRAVRGKSIRWSVAEMGHILTIYDRFTIEKEFEPGDLHTSPLRP